VTDLQIHCSCLSVHRTRDVLATAKFLDLLLYTIIRDPFLCIVFEIIFVLLIRLLLCCLVSRDRVVF